MSALSLGVKNTVASVVSKARPESTNSNEVAVLPMQLMLGTAVPYEKMAQNLRNENEMTIVRKTRKGGRTWRRSREGLKKLRWLGIEQSFRQSRLKYRRPWEDN